MANAAAQRHCARVLREALPELQQVTVDYGSPGPFVDSAVPNTGEHSSRDREAPTTAAAMAQQSASLTRQMACQKRTKLHPSQYVGG